MLGNRTSLSLICWLTFATLTLASGCVITPPLAKQTVSGRVLDEESGVPISDAYVVVQWESCFGMGHCSSFCVHIETTKTDDAGRFLILPQAEKYSDHETARLLHQADIYVHTYKQDYAINKYKKWYVWNEDMTGRRDRRKSNIFAEIKLHRDTSNTIDRLNNLYDLSRRILCWGDQEGEKALSGGISKALYHDANSRASFPGAWKYVVRVCDGLADASIVIHRDMASVDYDALEKNYLKAYHPECLQEYAPLLYLPEVRAKAKKFTVSVDNMNATNFPTHFSKLRELFISAYKEAEKREPIVTIDNKPTTLEPVAMSFYDRDRPSIESRVKIGGEEILVTYVAKPEINEIIFFPSNIEILE